MFEQLTSLLHEALQVIKAEAPIVAKYFVAAIVAAIGVLIALLLRRIVERNVSRMLPRHIAVLVEKLVYYTVLIITFISALAVAGYSLTGFVLAGSIVGFAVGFASQTIISNFLSGIFLYIDKPFKPGDPVEIDGIGGVVTDITIFSTRIRTWDGVYTRLPNSKVFEATIKNFIGNVVRRVEYRIGISYTSDIDKAINIIKKVLDEHPLVLVEPEPQVFVEELGDSAIILNVRFWAPSSHWFQAKTELLKLIKQALDREGIEIPFPQRVVWLHMVGEGERSDGGGKGH